MSDSEKIVNIETKLEGDIFENLDQLKIGQNFADVIGVKKKLTTVPVRKTSRQDFVMVHPNGSYHFQCAIFELKEDRTHFIVVRELWPLLPNEIVPKALYTTQNRQGVLFLWPVRLPAETGRLDPWNQSAHKAAQMAMETWVRVASNKSLGAYEIFTPTGELEKPQWPDLPFKEILKIAFQDNIIDSEDHPVLRNLRGEV